MGKPTMPMYRSSLRSFVKRLEREFAAAIRAGKPSDHIAVQLERARAELVEA
jgi:hypothetical protein